MDALEGEAFTIAHRDGGKLLREPRSGLITVSNCVDIAPLSWDAEQMLAALCEVLDPHSVTMLPSSGPG